MRWASRIDHPIGVHDQPDRGELSIAEDLVHRDQIPDQALDLIEHVVARQRHVQEGARKRSRRGEQAAFPREDLFEPPAGDVGEREQSQRLSGRRAVDDHGVVVAGLVMPLDLQQAEELVHARGNAQFLGGDVHDPAVGEQLAEPALDGTPIAFHLTLRLDLLAPKSLCDRRRISLERRLERVRETVCRDPWRARSCATPRPRSAGRWRRRRSSCRPRPCPCRGSSAAVSSGEGPRADATLAAASNFVHREGHPPTP